jgi:hypothetical protein
VAEESEEGRLRALISLPKRPLRGGRSLVELSTFDGIALWWFAAVEYHQFAQRLVRGGAAPARSRLRAGAALDAAYTLGMLFAALVGRVFGERIPPKGAGKRILFTCQNSQWRKTGPSADGQDRMADAFWAPVMEELLRRGERDFVSTFPLTGLDPWYRPWRGIRAVRARKRAAKPFVHRSFESFWGLGCHRARRRARKELMDAWRSAEGDPGFDEAALLAGVPGAALREEFRYYFANVLPRAAEQIETARRAVARLAPDVVAMLNEHGRFERALTAAARSGRVRVIALQHGVISEEERFYMFSRDEVSPDLDFRSPYVPLPDVTAVYGEYYRRLLAEKSSYPESAVRVTGAPRNDRLFRSEPPGLRVQVLGGLGLDPERKTVLWATQTHGLGADETRRSIEEVARMMAELPGVQLVVKLHPNEEQSGEAYRTLPAGRTRIASAEADTIALVRACDLLVTKTSTVALEAAALRKPVVILNLSGMRDIVDYSGNIALGATLPGELGSAVGKLLSTGSVLLANRETYLKDRVYSVDGSATGHVVDLLLAHARHASA